MAVRYQIKGNRRKLLFATRLQTTNCRKEQIVGMKQTERKQFDDYQNYINFRSKTNCRNETNSRRRIVRVRY